MYTVEKVSLMLNVSFGVMLYLYSKGKERITCNNRKNTITLLCQMFQLLNDGYTDRLSRYIDVLP